MRALNRAAVAAALTVVAGSSVRAGNECGSFCQGNDLNSDCRVNLTDLALLLSNYGTVYDLTDLARLLAVFGENCEPVSIESIEPTTGGPGDLVRITGSGFGSDPDDLCIVTSGGVLLEARSVSGTGDGNPLVPQQILAQIMPFDLNQGVGPGQLMVARGHGSRIPGTGIVPGARQLGQTWSWLATDDPEDMDGGAGLPPFVPGQGLAPEPFGPNQCDYWSASSVRYFTKNAPAPAGFILVDLNGTTWVTGNKITVFLRAYCPIRHPDVHIECWEITHPAPTPAVVANIVAGIISFAYNTAPAPGPYPTIFASPAGPFPPLNGQVLVGYSDCLVDGPLWRAGDNPSLVGRLP